MVHRPASNMHLMTLKKRLLRGALFLLLGGLIGAALLLGCGVRLRTAMLPADPCSACPSPSGAPEREDEVDHLRLGDPRPGEWRYRFKEEPQSFEEYRRELVNWKCVHRTAFYLQPLGDAGTKYRETLERMRLYAEAYFGVPARVLDPLPNLQDALDSKRGQDDAEEIIDLLSRRCPPDALVYMGITERDLFVRGLNFVFGVGERRLRTGIYSLLRYETEDLSLFTERTLKLLTHEAGHILSINHCVEYSCNMQGVNSVPEHDAHPMHLCPVDLQKVLLNTGMDRRERYRKLLGLYEKWDCRKEAQWVARRLER